MWTETDYTITTEEVAILSYPARVAVARLHRHITFNRYALLVACCLLLVNGVFLGVVMYQLGR